MTTVPNPAVTVSPQIHRRMSTPALMWTVSACLAPAAAWGVYSFGRTAALVLIAAVAAAIVGEALIALALRRFTVFDGSAFLTGLLIGMNMPPAVPLYVPVVASFFAIAVVKWTFGGLGTNWMNPALAGRVFVFFSWTGFMTQWKPPSGLSAADAVSAATPLSALKSGLLTYRGGAHGPMEFLAEAGYPRSQFAEGAVSWLNGLLGTDVHAGYVDLITGVMPGCIGEAAGLLLILGAVVLLCRRIITWHIPVSYLAVFGLLVWVFDGRRFGAGFFSGDVVFHLFSGGLLLGALYMATDMVTSPLTARGALIYGVGCGFLTWLIRTYGSFPEGVSLAIILMNIFTPLINRYTRPARFGVPRRGGDHE